MTESPATANANTSDKLDEHKSQETAEAKEIPASSVRSVLAELELKTSQIIQQMENVKVQPAGSQPHDIQAFLQTDKKHPADVLAQLELLIAHPDADDDTEFPMPPLDDVSHLALITNSIVAYLSHIDYRRLSRITSKVTTDTNRWLGHIFRFLDASASYHTDSTDATLRAVRLAIVAKCPGYLEGGIPALAHPCLYIGENNSVMSLQYACRQLGLPLDCIRLVPMNTAFGAIGTMDISALQKLIAIDMQANRTPVFVMAAAGASMCGYVDNLQRLQEVCWANGVWLHCRGHSLAALAVAQGSATDLKPIADSIALNLGSWLGIPSLPVVLLHRPIQNSALTVYESDPIMSRRLAALTLWTTLQAFGRESIATRIQLGFETCRIVYEITSKCEGIRVISKEIRQPLADIATKTLNTPILFEVAVPVVVFQFDGSQSPTSQSNGPSAVEDGVDPTQTMINKSIEKVANASYFDKLNSWLGQILLRDCPSVDLEIVDHPLHGTCLRFCPLELGLGDVAPTIEHLEGFANALEQQIDILRATCRHKATLNRLVESSEVLRLVNLPDWAGLGGVRFVPDGWEKMLTDQAKTELNKLNSDLVETLRNTDNAFSMGEGTDGLICVRFGMVTHDTDVEELLDLVVSVGVSVQENSRVLDTMSEIVKKGIEAATADLQRESDEKLWSDGILRHVPVVGSVFNWWSPPPKESGIKGRSLNLTQGVVQSTENIYKYHMQMSGGAGGNLPGNRSPPEPMVQTSVSAGHSRNQSQSSATSNAEGQHQQSPPAANDGGGAVAVSTASN